ncbi:MAG: ferritin-like domain-containing protein [Archangiaceae bacterium]|nr:ferritin-like domain-containing protein [Archangiaceae bacterium]
MPTPEQQRFAALAWPMKVAQERRSAAIFAELKRLAGVLGEHELEAQFDAARVDELRHAASCADVAVHFGEDPLRLLDESPVARRVASVSDGRLRLLSLTLVEVALGETLSTVLFRAGARRTRHPLSRDVLWQITRDEARHARLGWVALSRLWPTLDAAELDFATEHLRAHLGAMEREQALPSLLSLERGDPFDAVLETLGILSPQTRVDAFYLSVERQIIPRLERLGIDARKLWEKRYRTPSAE